MTNRPPKTPGTLRVRASRVAKASLIALAAAAMLTGGGGCKKPPPPVVVPPPPPPPPPPPTIKLEDLSQEMRADARVQFTPGMEIDESQAGLARAVIGLTDALARGDAAAVRPMLTRRAQGLLEELEQSGRWAEATGRIEAVRLVYLGPAPASATTGMGSMPDGGPGDTQAMMAKLGPAMAAMNAATMRAMQGVSAEVQQKLTADGMRQMQEMAARATAMTPAEQLATARESFDSTLKTLEESGAPAESLDGMRTAFAEVVRVTEEAAGGAPAGDDTSGGDGTGILLAIQEPGESYLLGWVAEKAFDKWVFTNAPAQAGTQARASGYDGIGEAGFGEMMAAGPPDAGAVGKPGADGADGSSSSSPRGDPAPSAPNAPAPTRKNTPSGPITIPGGG